MKDDTRVTTKATRSELVALVEALRLEVATLEDTLRGSDGTRELLERIQDGILVIDADTHRIREINPMAATMFGAPRDKIMGHECFEFICPAERGACPVTDLGVAVDHAERQMVTAAGGRKPILKTVARMTLGGDDVLVESFMDISERKQAEESLAAAASEWRETFDAMRDSVALFNEQGEVLRCNAATVGLTDRDYKELLGRPCFEVFHGAKTRRAGCPQVRARRTLQNETQIFRQDGHWLRVTFQPRLDAEGRFAGGVHIVSDVTDLKQAEQDLQNSVGQLQSLIEQVIAAIGGMVEARDPYTAGHEQRVSQLATAIAEHMKLDDDVGPTARLWAWTWLSRRSRRTAASSTTPTWSTPA